MPPIGKAKLEQLATDLLAKHELTGLPVPVEKLARQMGVQLRFSPLDDALAGMVYIKEGVAIIGVNSLHHPNRQRFTIAHEIAHLCLHRQLVEKAVHVDKGFPDSALRRDAVSATGMEEREVEANRFAAALLMPRAALAKELRDSPIDVEDETALDRLAKRFRVSTSTLQYRLRDLSPWQAKKVTE